MFNLIKKIQKKQKQNTSALCALVFLLLLLFPNFSTALTMSPVRSELSGDPGNNVVSQIKAINSEPTSKTYFTHVFTFEAGDENGTPTFKISKEDLPAWIKIDDAITLGPYQTKTIPFSISIPENAEPGGYFAGIFLTQEAPQTSEGDNVAISSELGTLVLLRVNGDIKEGVDILEFGTKDHSYFYNNVPVDFYFRFQNSGQTWVKPLGDIVIKNFFGGIAKIIPANKNEGNVLPQSIRRFENSWMITGQTPPEGGFWNKVVYQWRNFAFGPYTVQVNLAYGINSFQGASAKTHVFIFPWQLLLVIIIASTIAFYILRYGIRKYNKMIIQNAQKQNPNKKK